MLNTFETGVLRSCSYFRDHVSGLTTMNINYIINFLQYMKGEYQSSTTLWNKYDIVMMNNNFSNVDTMHVSYSSTIHLKT